MLTKKKGQAGKVTRRVLGEGGGGRTENYRGAYASLGEQGNYRQKYMYMQSKQMAQKMPRRKNAQKLIGKHKRARERPRERCRNNLYE